MSLSKFADTLTQAKDRASSTSQSLYREASERAGAVAGQVAFKADSAYQSASNSIGSAIDRTVVAVVKTGATVVVTAQAFATAGIAVAAVVAPVPTFVGLSVLFIMDIAFDAAKSDLDQGLSKELSNRDKKREFGRVLNILKKHGKIPETAVVKTAFVELNINSTTGNVNGKFLSGRLKDKVLDDLPKQDLIDIMPTLDKESSSVIEAYLSFRSKRDKQ